MTSPLRDKLAEMLKSIMDEYVTDPATRQSHLDTLEKYVASRLLERVPGEEALIETLRLDSTALLNKNQAEEVARFLREHMGVWL